MAISKGLQSLLPGSSKAIYFQGLWGFFLSILLRAERTMRTLGLRAGGNRGLEPVTWESVHSMAPGGESQVKEEKAEFPLSLGPRPAFWDVVSTKWVSSQKRAAAPSLCISCNP